MYLMQGLVGCLQKLWFSPTPRCSLRAYGRLDTFFDLGCMETNSQYNLKSFILISKYETARSSQAEFSLHEIKIRIFHDAKIRT